MCLRITSLLLFVLAIFIFPTQADTVLTNQTNPEPNSGLQDEFSWDFGKVKAGQILTHEFTLKNNSLTTLHIKNVNTSCGCTVYEVSKKELSPGENSTIKVQFDSQGYFGEVRQFVYVTIDNPDEPILKYTIKATVYR